MHDWHVTPEYINEFWTEEQFLLMFQKRNRRIRIEKGVKPKHKVDGDTFLASMGININVINLE